MCEIETQKADVARKLWHLIPTVFTSDEQKQFEDLYHKGCESVIDFDDEKELNLMMRTAKQLGLYNKLHSLINSLKTIK